jgi:hypothetical protein
MDNRLRMVLSCFKSKTFSYVSIYTCVYIYIYDFHNGIVLLWAAFCHKQKSFIHGALSLLVTVWYFIIWICHLFNPLDKFSVTFIIINK